MSHLNIDQVNKILQMFVENNIIFIDDEEPAVKKNGNWTIQQVDDSFVIDKLLELEL